MITDITSTPGSIAGSRQAGPQPGAQRSGNALPPQTPELPQSGKNSVKVEPPSLDNVTEALNAFMQANQRSIQFSRDSSSGRTIITVINSETHEVIRQIPPEQLLSLSSAIEKVLHEGGNTDAGMLLEERG